MIKSNSIIIISDIKSNIDDVLIQRLLLRIHRGENPRFLVIVDKEKNITDRVINILETINFPFMITEDIMDTPFGYIHKGEFPHFNEFPFSYFVINIGEENSGKVYDLAMDPALELVDNHMHTEFAYCNDNMEVEKAIELAKIFGLKSIKFTEHSTQLYFNAPDARDKKSYTTNISAAPVHDHRVSEYINMKKRLSSDFATFGLELDFDFKGNPMFRDEDLEEFDYILGAIHQLPEVCADDFMIQLDRVLKYGVDVLAHPFRIFKRRGKELPKEIIRPTAELLKKYNTAAELNFHTNFPPLEFVRDCLELGVKFSFGSDSHDVAEIGDFSFQLDLLKEAGFDGDLKDILWVMDKVPTVS